MGPKSLRKFASSQHIGGFINNAEVREDVRQDSQEREALVEGIEPEVPEVAHVRLEAQEHEEEKKEAMP